MNDLLGLAFDLFRGAVRYRWVAIAVAWIVCVLGWVGVALVPNAYQARAKMYVDTESLLRPLLQGLAVNSDVMSQVSMMRSFVMSRPNLERIARETDLALRAKSPAELEALVALLPQAIELNQAGSDKTYEVSFRDGDRAMAQRVVQAVLDSFVEDSLSLNQADASSAQRFLEQQIGEYERRLREAETKLSDFKRANVGLMPGANGDYYARLQAEVATLDTIQSALRQANERRVELTRQLEGEEPTFGLMPSMKGPTGAIDAQIAELKKKRDGLLVDFTERHPQVTIIDDQIRQLEERKRLPQAQKEPSPGMSGVDAGQLALRSLDVNPVYQNMKMSLSQAELEVASLRAKLGEQQRVVADLRNRVDTMPKVEAELAQLTRDYEVNRTQYSALLQRLESAKLSQQAQQSSNQVKFRIIEPPNAPAVPVFPNRLILMPLILIVGIIFGVGAAVAMSLVRPAFASRRALQAATGLPVIGSISAANAGGVGTWLSGGKLIEVGAAAGLFVVFFGIMAALVLMPAAANA